MYEIVRRDYGPVSSDYQVAHEGQYRASIAIAGHQDSRCKFVSVHVLGNYQPLDATEKAAIAQTVHQWASATLAWAEKPIRIVI